jgi:hypothetical protein
MGFKGSEKISTQAETVVLTSSGSGQCPAMVPSDHISEHSISKGGEHNYNTCI